MKAYKIQTETQQELCNENNICVCWHGDGETGFGYAEINDESQKVLSKCKIVEIAVDEVI